MIHDSQNYRTWCNMLAYVMLLVQCAVQKQKLVGNLRSDLLPLVLVLLDASGVRFAHNLIV